MSGGHAGTLRLGGEGLALWFSVAFCCVVSVCCVTRCGVGVVFCCVNRSPLQWRLCGGSCMRIAAMPTGYVVCVACSVGFVVLGVSVVITCLSHCVLVLCFAVRAGMLV